MAGVDAAEPVSNGTSIIPIGSGAFNGRPRRAVSRYGLPGYTRGIEHASGTALESGPDGIATGLMIVIRQRLAGLILAIVLAGSLIACGGANTPPASSPPESSAGTSGLAALATAGGSDYLTTVIKEHDDIAQSYNRFRGLMTNAQVTDTTWRTSVHLQLATWRQTYSEARKLTPPPELAGFHQKFLAGLEKFNSAADDITGSLEAESMDLSLFDSATVKLTDGIQLIQGAMPELGIQR